MNKLFSTLFVVSCIALSSCGGSNRDSNTQDSIDAARAADSMIQDQLNSDTSMNTDSTLDNMPTDSMSKGSDNR
ncbi:hypothetical protein WG906_14675 [Pedobacter sp. P351]|uniref:hypothetical protein n=1 Tax=Pedobacter superstes TaxID=3133441 RepID=UPI00309B5A52